MKFLYTMQGYVNLKYVVFLGAKWEGIEEDEDQAIIYAEVLNAPCNSNTTRIVTVEEINEDWMNSCEYPEEYKNMNYLEIATAELDRIMKLMDTEIF